MAELYENTMKKKLHLEEAGFVYHSIWECEWNNMVNDSKEVREFVQRIPSTEPLNPRDAFNGGRTETFKLYAEATETEKINYVDYTSLYPYINKYAKAVLGHPTRIFKDFGPLETYEGLIKCVIVPPRGLYIPLLQDSSTKKLIFGLCRSCAVTKQSSCSHSPEERAIHGTWTTDEVKKAVSLGYEITHIYEIWHFNEVEQYDPTTKTGGLFTDYINTFLKIKQEASGWPANAVTD